MKNKFVDPELKLWAFTVADVVANDVSGVFDDDDGIDTPNYPI